MTAGTAERNKTIDLGPSPLTRDIKTNEASVRYKTVDRNKVVESRNETGASTGQDPTVLSKNISPSTSAQVSHFMSPDIKSKKLLLRENLKAGRMTITTDKKNRANMDNIELMHKTSEIAGLQTG